MFAIVDIKGSQYKVEEKQTLFVPKVDGEKGTKIKFDKVLAFSPDGKSVEVGSPVLNHKVEATIMDHVKDDKVTVFKKKRRKGYKVTKGHRQQYTQIQIEKIK
jgi:large subunit ribosomal protein L21